MESSFDLGVYLNRHEKKHKHKPTQFRSVAGGVQKRLEDNLKHRKSSRLSTIDSKRNIPKCESPVPLSQAQLKIEHRRQQLEKWKQEKEKRKKEEAAKKKKPFVTGVVRNPVAFNPPPPLLPTRKVMLSTSDRVTRSQALKTSVPKAKTVAAEIKKVSFAPKNAQFRPPKTINLAEAPVLVPWTKNPKTETNLEVQFDPVTKNTKKSTSIVHTRSKAAHNKLDTKVTEKHVTKPENGNILRTRGGRYVKKPIIYLQSSSSSEIENLTEIIPNKTATRKTMPKKSPNRAVPKSESSSEEKLRSPKSPQSQLAAETFVTKIIPNTSSQSTMTPKNDVLERPMPKNELREEKLELTNSAKSPITPEQIKELSQQISPFVTKSRGKDKARQEMMEKIKEGLLDEDASNMESVKYFRQQLNSEIQRMTELCDCWDKTAQQNNLPETAQEYVLGAVGQARLLMSAKLQQFASLVARCERPEPGTALVTPADLHGFWDMVYMQIENINVRFLKLEELRSRGWAEDLPVPTAAAPSRAPSRAPGRVPRVKPTAAGQPSRLREMIAAARRAKKEQQAPSTPAAAVGESGAGGECGEESKSFEAGFFSVRSPVRTATPRAPSLLRLVLSNEADKSAAKRRASYAMLRASLLSRDVEVEGVEPLQLTPIQTPSATLAAEPGRSILKSGNRKRSIDSRSVKKIVYFDDSITDCDDTGEKEKDTATADRVEGVEEFTAVSGPSSTDTQDEGQDKENESVAAEVMRSPILTRSRRKTLDTPKDQREATPRRRKAISKIVSETTTTPRSSARKKSLLQESREVNCEAPALRRSGRRSTRASVN